MKKTLYDYKGRVGTVYYFAKLYKMNDATLYRRLQAGYSIEEAIELPPLTGKSRAGKHSYKEDVNKSLAFFSKKYNIPESTLACRMRKGNTIAEAIEYTRNKEKPDWMRRKDLTLRAKCKIANKDYEEAFQLVNEGKTENEALLLVDNPYNPEKEIIYKRIYMKDAYNKLAQTKGFKDRAELIRYQKYCNKFGEITVNEWKNLNNSKK